MMSKNALVTAAKRYFRENSVEIMMATGITGTLTTAYLSAKAGHNAAKQAFMSRQFCDDDFRMRDSFKLGWRLYIPPAITASTTIGAIVCGFRINTAKTAAVYSLLTTSERMFEEYKAHVVEELGVNKERALRDKVAQDDVTKNPPTVVLGSGTILCKESYTGRYFESDMETIRKAVNTINAKLIREVYVTLDDFYWEIKLPSTDVSERVGWDSDKMLEINYSTSLTPDGKPCLCIEYNYLKPL